MAEEKPSWMTHKDWFVKKLSRFINMNESLVDRVIKHQFESIVNASRTMESVEISGMGKFIFRRKGAQKKLDKLDRQIRVFRNRIANSESETLKQRWNEDIDSMLLSRQVLINRLSNETNADLRRMEESPASKRVIEGKDK
jgi:nucleoid DNA-binding protein